MGLRKYIGKKSLFVLPACCLALVSCGKKPIGSEGSKDPDITAPLSKSVSLELDFTGDAALLSKSYMFQEDAGVIIPKKIHLKTGQPLNYIVNIYFNTNHSPEQRDATDEFFCSYKSIKQIGETENPSPDGYTHVFEDCFESLEDQQDGRGLGFIPGETEIVQKQWQYIRMDLVRGYSTSKATIHTEFSVNWF